jgi:hypothetical protein
MYLDATNKIILRAVTDRPMSTFDFYRAVREKFAEPNVRKLVLEGKIKFPVRVSVNGVLIMLHGWTMSDHMKELIKTELPTVVELIPDLPQFRLIRS